MAPGLRISRNMTIVRQNGELTVISAVRLNADGEAALAKLGAVKHVVRIGNFHGMDDAYYVERFGAEFWCQPGSRQYATPVPTKELVEGGPLPFDGGQLFVFREARAPEAALLIERHGGVLITCDALQHWSDRRNCSLLAKLMMPLIGFPATTVVGPPWLKGATPKGGSLKADFERLLTLEFKHHLAAHGGPCLDDAHTLARAAVSRAFPI